MTYSAAHYHATAHGVFRRRWLYELRYKWKKPRSFGATAAATKGVGVFTQLHLSGTPGQPYAFTAKSPATPATTLLDYERGIARGVARGISSWN